MGVVKKCELSRSTVLKSFTHKQKADNPVFPSCSPLKVFEVTYTCTYKTCILFTKTEVVSRVAIQSLNGECTFICIKTQGICQLPWRKHGCVHAVKAKEALDGRKNKSYKKKIILSKVFCWPPVVDWLSSLNSSNPQIVLTWGPVSGWVEWVRRFHKYPVILTLNGQKRITPKVCLTSEHKYCHNQQNCVPRGFSTVQLANQCRCFIHSHKF